MAGFTRYQLIAAFIIAAVVLGGTILMANRPGAVLPSTGEVRLIEPGGRASEADTPTVTERPRVVRVHVAGKVGKPGVYEIEPGSRVQDAIEAAGGTSADADLESINLAEKLRDGQQIYIAPKGRIAPPPVSVVRGGESASSDKSAKTGESGGKSAISKLKKPGEGMVSINSADANGLQRLVGVGPAMAQRIIDYRNEHGGFKSVEELDEVKGIGPKTLAKMKPFVKL